MSRRAVLLVLAGLLVVVVVLVLVLEGTGEDPPRNNGDKLQVEPEYPADPNAALCRRIRDSLGRDMAAVVSLGDTRPAGEEAGLEWLRRYRPEIDLAIRSGDPDAGTAALHILGEALATGAKDVRVLITSSGYREVWLRAVEAKDPMLRAAGADFLGKIGDEKSRAMVAAMLADESPVVRGLAVRAYAKLAERTGAARLANLFETEPDFRVRLNVLDAFQDNRILRGPDARRVERHAMEQGTDAERIQAMSNLARFRDQDALDLVVANLGHANVHVRKSAVNALRLLKDRRALSALRSQAATEKDSALRDLTETVVRELSE